MAYVNTLIVTDATSEGLIVATNTSVPEASAKILQVLEGGVANETMVYAGGTAFASNGGVLSDGVASGGSVWARNGGTVSNFNIEGNARALIWTGGVWSGGVISGTGECDNYGTNGGGLIRGVTLQAGTLVGARFAGNLADTIRVEGGNLHIQRGGSGVNITQIGGGFYVSGSGTARSYASGLFIQGGNCYLTNLADVENVNVMNNGTLRISGNCTATGITQTGGSVIMSGAAIAAVANTVAISAGTLTISAGASATGITQTGGSVIMSGAADANAKLNTISISDGTLAISAGASAVGITQTGGTVNVSGLSAARTTVSGATVTGGAFNIGPATLIQAIDVSGDGRLSLASGFGLYGDINFEAGTLTNDADAHAEHGTISDLTLGINGYYGHGITLKNYTHTAATCYVIDDAVVDGGTVTGGTMQALSNVSANGAVIKNVTFDGSGAVMIVRGATNRVEGATFKKGTYHIQSGAQGADLTLEGGTLNATSGSISGGTITGGTINFNNGFTVTGVTMTGGTANANATLTMNDTKLLGLNVNGGTVAVNSGSVLTDANVKAGTVTVNSTGILDGVDVSGTGKLTLAGGFTLRGDIDFAAGQLTNDADAYAEDGTIYDLNLGILTSFGHGVTLRNYTHTANTGNLTDDAVASGGTVTGGTFQALVGNGADGALIRDFTISGGTIIVRGATNRAENITISAGTMHVQVNATADGVEVLDGASVQNANNNFAGAVVSNLTLRAGATGNFTNTTSGARIYNVTMEDGAALNVKFGSVSGGTVAGGTLNVSNVDISDLAMTGGTLNASGTVAVSAATVANLNQTAGTARVYDGSVVEGGLMKGTVIASSGATIDGLAVSGLLHISSGAVANDVTLENIGTTANRVYVSAGGRANRAVVRGGEFYVYGAAGDGLADDLAVSGGQAIIRYAGNSAQNVAVSAGGKAHIQQGASASIIDVRGGEFYVSGSGGGVLAQAELVRVSGGKVSVNDHSVVSNINMTGGNVSVLSGGVVSAVEGNTLHNLLTSEGAKVCFVKDGGQATLVGDSTRIAEGTLWYEGTTQLTGHGANGVISGLGAGTSEYKLSIGSGIVLKNATGNNYGVRISAFSGAKISGALINAGAIIGNNGDAVEFADVTLSAGHGSTCNLNLSAGGQTATGTTIGGSGAKLQIFAADASIENTTLKAGGSMNLAAAGIDTGKLVTLDFTGTTGDQLVDITNLSRLAADTKLAVRGVGLDATYTLTKGSTATDKTLDLGTYRIFDEQVAAGSQYSNAFLGRNLDFRDGKKLVTGTITVAFEATAAKFSTETATELADGGFAARWNGDTAYAGNVTVADSTLGGNAWLTLDGFNVNTANIYGAEGAFAHDVNMWLYSGTVKNLAAGAKVGGSVENVNLLVSDANENGMTVKGALYAGGMGDVAGEVTTRIYGGTFSGNVFAGALCNYVANNTATATGDISLTVDGGTFSGNVYAGAAVKAGAAATVVHTAGDITVELNGGTAPKQAFCVYGGGYATGTTANKVYEAGDVVIGVTGGAWGTYLSGRGIFGGVYADTVAASVDSVLISVTGGKMGNVYGGGWAQNGGTSTVGDVTVTIAGDAEVNNVFGGGSYSSTSGGTTEVGNVTILVAGGDITDNIFAGGQSYFSTVTGDVSVSFTGSNDYGCNVYGYGFQASATELTDKLLTFADYTGTITGNVGGFDNIRFTGDTAATLSGGVDSNDWSFDYTERTLGADTAMLTLSTGSFAGDNIAVDISTATQLTEWSIATGVSNASAIFEVELSTGSASGLSLGQALDETYGDYAGWGFALEDSTLKFKQLA